MHASEASRWILSLRPTPSECEENHSSEGVFFRLLRRMIWVKNGIGNSPFSSYIFLPLLHQNSCCFFIRERKSRAHRNDIIFDSCVTVSWCDFHAPGDSVETFHSTPTGCRRTPLLGAARSDFVPYYSRANVLVSIVRKNVFRKSLSRGISPGPHLLYDFLRLEYLHPVCSSVICLIASDVDAAILISL